MVQGAATPEHANLRLARVKQWAETIGLPEDEKRALAEAVKPNGELSKAPTNLVDAVLNM